MKYTSGNKIQNRDYCWNVERFGACTNTKACEMECPKHVTVTHIARLNREFLCAKLQALSPSNSTVLRSVTLMMEAMRFSLTPIVFRNSA